MRRMPFVAIFIALTGILFFSPAQAQENNVNVEFEQLRRELFNSKLPARDMNATSQVLMALLKQGAPRGDLRKLVLSVAGKGVAGTDLSACLDSVRELMDAGVKVNEAGSIVLQGMDQGLALGFKGGDIGLLEAVREAVMKKKEELLEEAKSRPAEKVSDQAAGPLDQPGEAADE